MQLFQGIIVEGTKLFDDLGVAVAGDLRVRRLNWRRPRLFSSALFLLLCPDRGEQNQIVRLDCLINFQFFILPSLYIIKCRSTDKGNGMFKGALFIALEIFLNLSSWRN